MALRRAVVLRLLVGGALAGLFPAPAPSLAAAAPAVEVPSSRARGEEALHWLRAYLRIDTSNPPGNEAPAAAYLREILHREGIATRQIVSRTGRVSLMARLEAADPGAGAIVLQHHLDIVPPGPGWNRRPLSADLEAGYLWGRGAVDDKSLGIAHLAAFLDLHRSQAELTHDVIFLAVADEESGGGEGMAWLLRNQPELLAGVVGVLGEGGSNRTVQGRNVWWGIEVAQKRALWLKASVWGRRGHGSTWNPGSAPHKLVRGLARLLERPVELRLSPQVRSYFEAIAPYEGRNFRESLPHLEEHLAGTREGFVIRPGMPSYLADSLQVNTLEAGSRVNVAPGTASALIDIRLLPDTDTDAFLADVRERLGKDVDVEVLLESPESPPSPTDDPLFQCVEGALLPEGSPVVPAFIPGVTDSRYFRERGIPAYGFSPFVIDGLDLMGIHGADEKIPVQGFLDGVERMIRVVRACVTR
jgi:acetylornithine deacetylase/succinyl-diaminopimelate desuccinylase-like protein